VVGALVEAVLSLDRDLITAPVEDTARSNSRPRYSLSLVAVGHKVDGQVASVVQVAGIHGPQESPMDKMVAMARRVVELVVPVLKAPGALGTSVVVQEDQEAVSRVVPVALMAEPVQAVVEVVAIEVAEVEAEILTGPVQMVAEVAGDLRITTPRTSQLPLVRLLVGTQQVEL
jgi:hypothetical protein